MKIILKLGRPPRLYRVDISEPASAMRVRRLIGKGRYSQAVVATLSSKGSVEEVAGSGIAGLGAELLLTENSAHWDASPR
ncbi:MAG: hypothetical protein NC938_04885 [Candidatus Omnitrophica bacterium]|nr:hypothetical protein [Candidatus Omnitrophota bacterium]MCM8791018.1 hypothetical protein [Candidatus Omnitrophota bacterium]